MACIVSMVLRYTCLEGARGQLEQRKPLPTPLFFLQQRRQSIRCAARLISRLPQALAGLEPAGLGASTMADGLRATRLGGGPLCGTVASSPGWPSSRWLLRASRVRMRATRDRRDVPEQLRPLRKQTLQDFARPVNRAHGVGGKSPQKVPRFGASRYSLCRPPAFRIYPASRGLTRRRHPSPLTISKSNHHVATPNNRACRDRAPDCPGRANCDPRGLRPASRRMDR